MMAQSPSQVNCIAQNPHKRPGNSRLQTLQAIALGADGRAIFFLLNRTDQQQQVILPGDIYLVLNDEQIAGQIEIAVRDVVVLLEQWAHIPA